MEQPIQHSALLIAMLLLASSQLPGSAEFVDNENAPAPGCRCSYGTQAGVWTRTSSQGEGWVSLNGDCMTQNLLYQLAPRRAPDSKPLHILLFGDSIDGCIMNSWCSYVYNTTRRQVQQWPPFKWHDRYNLSYCQTDSGMDMAHFFSVGVHPEGPYYENNLFNYTLRLHNVKQELRKRWRTNKPDIVITSSGLWDIARLVYMSEQEYEAWGKPADRIKAGFIEQHPALPRPFLDSWMRNMSHMVASIRGAFPEALVMMHTTAAVCHDPDGGSCSRPLGRQLYISQLSAAARQVAASLDVPLVDMEGMSTALGFSQYLQDGHHPKDNFLLESLNIFLNIYEQQRRCGTLPIGNQYAAQLAAAGRAAAVQDEDLLVKDVEDGSDSSSYK